MQLYHVQPKWPWNLVNPAQQNFKHLYVLSHLEVKSVRQISALQLQNCAKR